MEKTYFLRSSVLLMSTKKVGSHSDSEKKQNKTVHDNKLIELSEVGNWLNSPYVG